MRIKIISKRILYVVVIKYVRLLCLLFAYCVFPSALLRWVIFLLGRMGKRKVQRNKSLYTTEVCAVVVIVFPYGVEARIYSEHWWNIVLLVSNCGYSLIYQGVCV